MQGRISWRTLVTLCFSLRTMLWGWDRVDWKLLELSQFCLMCNHSPNPPGSIPGISGYLFQPTHLKHWMAQDSLACPWPSAAASKPRPQLCLSTVSSIFLTEARRSFLQGLDLLSFPLGRHPGSLLWAPHDHVQTLFFNAWSCVCLHICTGAQRWLKRRQIVEK